MICTCGDTVPWTFDAIANHLRLIHCETLERWPDGELVVVDLTEV